MIVALFGINALLHLIQVPLLGANKSTIPVFAYGLVLLLITYLWFSQANLNWLSWVSLILPILGGSALASQLKTSKNPKWIDYSILGLDVLTVLVMVNYFLK